MNDELIAARVDRLPVSRFHKRLLLLVSLPFFFDISDIFTFSYAAPALVKEWGLPISSIALLTSAGFFGMFVGATLGGMLSDKIGRKRALVVYVIAYSTFSLANALAPDIPMLIITRVLTGVGISSATAVVMAYIAEMFPAKTRGTWQGWAMVIALCGIPITSWVPRLVVPSGPDGWRWIFVWGSLGILFLLFLRHFPESPRWLARQGRTEEADRVLRGIETEVEKTTGPLPEAVAVNRPVEARAHWTSMFKGQYIGRTMTLWAIWIFQTLGFYGFQAWVPTLLVKHGITIVHSLTYITLINIGAVPGALIAVFLADRMERKFSIAAAAALIAVFGLLYGLSFEPVLIVSFGFLVGMLIQTFAALCYAYTPEQYPTDIRNTGAGFAYGMGRLANVGNSFIVAAIFTNFGYVWVFVYIAGAWLATSAVTLIFGARTTGRRLETINPVHEESVDQRLDAHVLRPGDH
ncbi:MFS transporter [Paraburkholderia sp. CNPSo 3157]|uniref:MFS transporter n=1 Tax=Paraburkholderia franconis TaxID=2654983 RepID=A0A7X1THX4_9BURK|nr:MFS transporter [Paraburkholderia franconis]MPW19619.1 MFS transporter [Paraburkholderia franconis]